MAEAYGKAMVADVVLSLSRKPLEKSTGCGRLFIAKNRVGRDGILFPVHLDTSKSKIRVVEEAAEMSLCDVIESDKSDMKNLLKKKWRQVNS
jgi:hypothetical protein